MEWALRRRRREALRKAREFREGGRWLLTAARRISELPPTYDSEEEEETEAVGFAGLVGRRWYGENVDGESASIPAGYEPEDYGEEVERWTKVLRRTGRRMDIWDGDRDLTSNHVQVQHHHVTEDVLPPIVSRPLTNGARKKARKRASSVHTPVVEGGRSTKSTKSTAGRDLNDEITADLLAERSDDDMDDDDSIEADGDGEGDDSDVDMD